MGGSGWRGYSEHEFQMALFVRAKLFQHYGIPDDEQAVIGEVLSLLAIYHLRDQGQIVLKAGLAELFSGFPWGVPDDHQAEEIAREHLRKYDVSQPLKELLFAVVLVEITTSFLREGKLIWVAPPGGRREGV